MLFDEELKLLRRPQSSQFIIHSIYCLAVVGAKAKSYNHKSYTGTVVAFNWELGIV